MPAAIRRLSVGINVSSAPRRLSPERSLAAPPPAPTLAPGAADAARAARPEPWPAWLVLVLALASAVPIVTVAWAGAWFHEDCYITLTYARNLATGNGFVYNAAPASLGTTTPLYTFWLAALHASLPNVDLSLLLRISGAACWLAAGWLVVAFRRALQLAPAEAGLVAAAILVAGSVRSTAMEAPAFAATFVLFLGLFARSLQRAPRNGASQALLGALVGAAMLVRGEAALLGAIAAAGQFFVQWRVCQRPWPRAAQSLWPLALGFALVGGAWVAYAMPTFGHVLPASLEIKRLQMTSGKWASFAYSMLCEWLPSFEGQFRAGLITDASPLWQRYLNPWFALVAFGALAVVRRFRWWSPVPLFGLVYTLGYTALHVSSYWWYALPVLFSGHVLAALGLAHALRLRQPAVGWRPRALRIAVVGAYLALVAAPRLADGAQGPIEQRRDCYPQLAAWFSQHAQSHEAIAYVEVGYLGYFTRNPVLDLCGLTSPEVVPFLRTNDLPGAVFTLRPPWYVHNADFSWLDGAVVADPRFAQAYEPVAELKGPWQAPLRVYRLRGSAAPAPAGR